MNKNITKAFLPLLLAGLLGLTGGAALAADNLDQKLQQCQAAFQKSRRADLPQNEARKAEQEHLKLMVEIMQDLNKRAASDKSLSPEEVRTHLRVMGHLVEMLGVKAMPPEYEWNYLY